MSWFVYAAFFLWCINDIRLLARRLLFADCKLLARLIDHIYIPLMSFSKSSLSRLVVAVALRTWDRQYCLTFMSKDYQTLLSSQQVIVVPSMLIKHFSSCTIGQSYANFMLFGPGI